MLAGRPCRADGTLRLSDPFRRGDIRPFRVVARVKSIRQISRESLDQHDLWVYRHEQVDSSLPIGTTAWFHVKLADISRGVVLNTHRAATLQPINGMIASLHAFNTSP